MTASIQPQQLSALPPAPPAPAQAAPASSGFKNYLLDAIAEMNSMQQDANRAVESLATGGEVNPVEVLTAVQKADLAFRTMMQIRNKLVQAYQEVQSIRV